MKKNLIINFCITFLINIIIATLLVIFSPHIDYFLKTLMILGISIIIYTLLNLFFYFSVKFNSSLCIGNAVLFIGLIIFSFMVIIGFFYVLICHEYFFVIMIIPVLTTSINWLIIIYNEKYT